MNLGFNGGQTAINFGGLASTSAPSSAFNFGAPISSMAQTSTAATPFSLSTQPAQTTAFNLSTQVASSNSLFGTTNTSLPSAGFFNLGTSGSTQPALSTGLTIGLGNFGFSASSAATTNTATSSLVTNATMPAKVGLGGVNFLESNQPAATTTTTIFNNENKSIKESPVEPLIANLVTDFTKFMKEQKNTRDVISHWSAGTIGSVGSDVKMMTSSLHNLNMMVRALSTDVQTLKITSKQELTNGESVQKTHSLPMSHQYENVLPMRYFQQLITSFDERMFAYRHEILVVEEFIEHITDNHTLSPQEFGQIFKKLSLGLVELTAQIQVVYESIKELKSNYNKFRLETVADGKYIFSSSKSESRTPLQILNENRTPSTIGPSIFSGGSPKGANMVASTPRYSSLFSTPTSFQNQASPFAANSANQNSLFGNPTSTASSFGSGPNFGTNITGTGLFGSAGTGSGSGLFGNMGTGSSGGLFGNTSASTSGGLFGAGNFAANNSPGVGAFGSTSFGASAQKSSGNKRGKNN